MDIGAAMGLEEEAIREQYWGDEEEWYYEESPIDAVSPNTQCHNCGLQGHIAKGCTAKRKGKGANATKGGKKGKGKGGEKGWIQKGWNEKGWNNKGGRKVEERAAGEKGTRASALNVARSGTRLGNAAASRSRCPHLLPARKGRR